MTYPIVLFDIDGVLITPPEPFSYQYARRHNFDPETLQAFFSSEDFLQALRGQLDIREAIQRHASTWHLDGTVDDVLQEWLASENYPNDGLVRLISFLRSSGVRCFAATDQEKARSEYLQKSILPDVFDGWFVSSDFGLLKSELAFFKHVYQELHRQTSHLMPQRVAYIDDSDTHLGTGRSIGFTVHKYRNVEDTRSFLGSQSLVL